MVGFSILMCLVFRGIILKIDALFFFGGGGCQNPHVGTSPVVWPLRGVGEPEVDTAGFRELLNELQEYRQAGVDGSGGIGNKLFLFKWKWMGR